MVGYWGLNTACGFLEDPYGEDAGDIPLILNHKDFVTQIDELRECRRLIILILCDKYVVM
jgi:hypothetical protein